MRLKCVQSLKNSISKTQIDFLAAFYGSWNARLFKVGKYSKGALSLGNWKLLENIFYLRCQQHFCSGHEPIFKCPEVGLKNLKLLKIMQDCRAVLERNHKYSLIFCYCQTGTSSQVSINTAEKLKLLAHMARCKHEILFVCYIACIQWNQELISILDQDL